MNRKLINWTMHGTHGEDEMIDENILNLFSYKLLSCLSLPGIGFLLWVYLQLSPSWIVPDTCHKNKIKMAFYNHSIRFIFHILKVLFGMSYWLLGGGVLYDCWHSSYKDCSEFRLLLLLASSNMLSSQPDHGPAMSKWGGSRNLTPRGVDLWMGHRPLYF